MKRSNYLTHSETVRQHWIQALTGNNSFTRNYVNYFNKILFLFALICCGFNVNGQNISVTNVAYSPVCAGTNVTITFAATNGTGAPSYYTNSTVYTIYLSNSAGANYTSQGTFSTSGVTYDATDGGVTTGITQSFTIPGGTTAGTGYKISLGSTTPTFDGSTGTGASSNINVVLTAGAPGQPGGITGNVVICDGASGIQYSVQPAANAVSYNWGLPVGATIATGAGTRIITVNYPTPFTGGTICVSSVNACGSISPVRCLTVTNILTFNPGRIVGNRSVCLNSTGNVYTANNINGATNYNWTLPAGMTITAGAGTRNITVSVGPSLTPGPLCVSVDNACGTSLVYCINITLTTGTQPGGISGPAQVCANTSGLVYSVQPITGATSYSWTLPPDFNIVSGAGTRIITVDIGPAPASGDVCVTADFPCGPSIPRCKSVIFTAPVAGTITGPTHLCAGTTGLVYTVTFDSTIISYNWTFPPGITQASGGNTNSITVDVGTGLTVGDICVTVTDICGTSAPSCFTVKDYSYILPGGITGPHIVCQNDVGLVFSVQQVPDAVSYIWSVPQGITITGGVGTNAITVEVDNTYTVGDIGVRAVSSCGTESLIRWFGYVNTIPSMAGAITAASPICRNASVDFSIIPLLGISDYEWTLPEGMTFAVGSQTDTNFISVEIDAAFAQGIICVKGISACGVEGYSRCATFNAIPDRPGAISGPVGVCGGATGLSYSIEEADGAASYNWELPIGWNITSGTGTNSIVVDAAPGFIQGQIRVNSVSACGNNSGFRILNVHGTPADPGEVSGATAVCNGNIYIYSLESVPGAATYSWILPAGMSFTAGPPTNTNTVSVNVGGTFTGGDICVTASTSCGGPSDTSCLAVGLTPDMPGIIAGDAAVCAGTTGVIYSIEATPGVSVYNWIVPADITIVSGQGTDSIVVDFDGGFTSGQICIEGQNACGNPGAPSCLDVSLDPATPTVITPALNFCPGNTAILTVGEVSGAASYTWTVPAGLTIISGQGFGAITVEIDPGFISGIVCVTAESACGASGSQYCQNISVDGSPVTPTNINSNGIVCPGGDAEFSVITAPGAGIFTWTVPPGMNIVSGQGLPTLTVAVDPGYSTGDVCITLTSACGGASGQFCKTFSSTPGTPGGITAPSSVCANDPQVIFSVSEMAGVSSYNWVVPAGITITSGAGTNAITTAIGAGFTSGQIAVSASSACSFIGATRSITVGSTLSIPGGMTGPTTVCPNATGIVFSVPEITGAISYTWSVPGAFTITSGLNTNAITINASGAFTSGQVSVTALSECGLSSPARTISVVSAFGVPGAITAPTDICQNSTGLVFSVPAVSGASSYAWTVPVDFTITSGTGTNSITVDVGPAFTSGQVCVAVVSSCGLSGPQRCMLVSNLPGQPGGVTGQKTGVCDQTLQYSVQPANLATSYTWTAPAGASITSGQGTRIVQVTFTNTFTSGQLQVYSSNGCGNSAPRLSAILTGAPAQPSVTSGPSSVCANQGGYSYNCTTIAGATTYTWAVPPGAIITSGQGTTHIVVTYGISGGQISVTSGNACGNSLAGTKNIAIVCRVSGGSSMVMGMNVYPSPAVDVFTVDFNSQSEAKHLVEVLDLSGKLLISNIVNSVVGNNQISVDATSLSQGVYIVKLTDQYGNTSIGRVIIQ